MAHLADSLGMRLLWVTVLSACTASEPVAVEPDAPVVPAERPFATYTIPAGEHSAFTDKPELHSPIDGVTSVDGRDYELVLDASASYVLTSPAQPEDQYDWNKLPGLSDCGTVDLAKDGAMFGWRWNVDAQVIEIAAYANNAGVHLTNDNTVLVTLDAADLAAEQPLRYTVSRIPTHYLFEIHGEVRGRVIDASASLPRRCVDMPTALIAWAGAFYFGGTSVAPQTITAKIREY